MRYKRKKRNAPIATLIKNYINKKSGKVSESREEIKWRFNWLDWKDQKRILTAFLDSGRSDREWAYGKVFDYWDESFLQKIKELWETYHENKCSWSVIHYFPIDYILEHMEDFTDERDYFFICLRLAKDKSFVWPYCITQTVTLLQMMPAIRFSPSFMIAVRMMHSS